MVGTNKPARRQQQHEPQRSTAQPAAVDEAPPPADVRIRPSEEADAPHTQPTATQVSDRLAAAQMLALRSTHADLGNTEGHVGRLASLLREARSALSILSPSGNSSVAGAASGQAVVESGAGNSTSAQQQAAGRLSTLDLERQLVVTITEVLFDVEGELRSVAGRLRTAQDDLSTVLAAASVGDDSSTPHGAQTDRDLAAAHAGLPKMS